MKKDRKLTDIFVVPPISVMDVKQKYWKDRRKNWLSLNIQSELGREENLLSLSDLMARKQKSTSIFDPVLCEIMYLWFTKKDDLIYDRFCGGSVRGIVANKLDRDYIGIDIRQEQLDSNKLQIKDICKTGVLPRYYLDINDPKEKCDFIFTCPPYWNLEVYSNLDNDLSNMDEDVFWDEYSNIITSMCSVLKEDRFAVIVVGDVRRADGSYIRLPDRTSEIFEKAGLRLYNTMVLLQEPATAAMRSFKFMNSSRKIAKAHQNVLVYVKGDEQKAADRLNKFSDDSSNNLVNNFFSW